MEVDIIPESCSRNSEPSYGEEVQTGAEDEFTEEVCSHANQEHCGIALSKWED